MERPATVTSIRLITADFSGYQTVFANITGIGPIVHTANGGIIMNILISDETGTFKVSTNTNDLIAVSLCAHHFLCSSSQIAMNQQTSDLNAGVLNLNTLIIIRFTKDMINSANQYNMTGHP